MRRFTKLSKLKLDKTTKRCLATFLIITLIAPLTLSWTEGSRARASEVQQCNNWTYATAGLEDDATMYADVAPLLNEEKFELGGSKFSGYINFKESDISDVAATWSPSRLVFGNKAGDSWGEHAIRFGLRELEVEVEEGVVEVQGPFLSCGTTNGQTWLFRDKTIQADQEIFLQVAFDYVDKDNENVENDLQLHVWIDGEPATVVGETWDDWLDVTGEDIWLEDYLDTENPVMANVMFTADNMPMEYRSVNEVTLSGIENNKIYCDSVEVSIGTSAADGLYEKDLASVTVNGTAVQFTEGKYTIPAGTGATTLVVTDKMDNTTTYNITVNEEHEFGKGGICTACGTKNPQEYRTWTFATAGIEDYERFTTEGITESMSYATIDGERFDIDKSIFRGYVTFGGAAPEDTVIRDFDGPLVGFGAPDGVVYGNSLIRIGLTYSGEQTYLTCGLADVEGQESINEIFTELPVAIGEEILLELFFNCVDHDGDDVKDDLKLGIWVNDSSITDTYLYFDNYTVNETTEKGFIYRYIGDNATEDTYLEVRSAEVQVVTDEFTYDLAECQGASQIPLHNSKFSGYITFGGAAPEYTQIRSFAGPLVGFGTAEADTYGDNLIKFGLTYSEGQTYLSCGVTNAIVDDSLDVIFTEQPVAIGEEILLQCTFECIDNDQDEVKDDLKLGVWVNNTPVNDTYLYLNNYATDENAQKAYICRSLNQSEEEQYITVRSASSEAEMDYIGWSFATANIADGTLRSADETETNDFARLGGYVLLGKGSIQVNGRTLYAGDVLQSTGDYLIQRLYNGVTYEQMVHLTDSRSNPVKIPALTYDAIGGDEVMPIYGHYLPWWKTYQNEDGSATDIGFTSDEYYELVREAGINMILWTETNGEEQFDAVLEQLHLAEKYNMGMYVWDTTFESLATSDYWERLSEYSNYRSFLGINSIDEPTTASYGNSKDTRGDSYLIPASTLNMYTNLIGYVNAFPMLDKLNRTDGDLADVYTNYIRASILDAGGKIIPYDRYPVEYDWTEEQDGKYVMVNSPDFYRNLSIIRGMAAQNTLPFEVSISTGDYCNAEDTYRQMQREELLWSINVALAYGAKAISYYTMVEVDTSTNVGNDGAAEHGLIDCRGNKTKWYGYVQEANRQIEAIDHVLMKSLNQGVIAVGEDSYVSNCVNTLEECISKEEYTTYNLKNVETTGEEYGALMGVFQYYPNEDAGESYDAYYIVNSDTSSKQTIQLEFNEAVTYSIISQANPTYVGTESAECSITVPAGEGVLIVLGKDLTQEAKEPEVVWYDNISPYRVNESTDAIYFRAPEMGDASKEGYVFAGWFADTACTIPIGEHVTKGGAYARFVDADILGVKVQYKPDETALRFVSSVDRLDYQTVGFDIRNGRTGITTESKEVYSQLYGMEGSTVMEFSPTVCSMFSTRFFAFTIFDIPTEMKDVPFIVNSYWMTKDGTKVYGDSVSYSIEEAIDLPNKTVQSQD